MALTDITDKILTDAKVKSEEIAKEAEVEAKRILEDVLSESAKIKENILKKAERQSAKKLKSAEISFKLKLKNTLLREKQDILDEVFKTSKKILLGLDRGEYKNLIKSMLLVAVKTGSEEVIISEKDKDRLDEGFFNLINSELVQSGKKGNLRPIFDKSLEGGLILRNKNIQTNCSIDTILKLIRPEIESEIVGILFG